MDFNLAIDHLLNPQPFKLISRLHIHGDWVSGSGDLVTLTFDLGEDGGEAVPLGAVLCATGGVG